MMQRKRSNLISYVTALAALMLLAAVLVGPAVAKKEVKTNNGKSSSHAQAKTTTTKPQGAGSDKDGDADNSSTVHTENNDSDGVQNAGDTSPSAHRSGKDRYLENGKDTNQGHSESDPDDNGTGPERKQCDGGNPAADPRTNGSEVHCTDKANGEGGTDILDQDGNNGCGNDQDFDDDNEGQCKGRLKHEQPPETPPETPPNQPPGGPTVRGGGKVRTPRVPTVVRGLPKVKGRRVARVARGVGAVSASRAVAPAAVRGRRLPFTGSDVLGISLLALAMIAIGGLLTRLRRA